MDFSRKLPRIDQGFGNKERGKEIIILRVPYVPHLLHLFHLTAQPPCKVSSLSPISVWWNRNPRSHYERRQRQSEPLDTGFQVHTPSILHCLIFNVRTADKPGRLKNPLLPELSLWLDCRTQAGSLWPFLLSPVSAAGTVWPPASSLHPGPWGGAGNRQHHRQS